MKKAFLLLFLIGSFFAEAQSLKEALFSGKLKNEPGTVIRKGDDLSDKMVTATQKEPARDTLAIITVAAPTDSAQKTITGQHVTADSALAGNTGAISPVPADSTTPAVASTETEAMEDSAVVAASEPVTAPKNNNALWKEFIVNLTPLLKAEVLSSKKVKSGSYYVLVSYAIDTDGQTTITDVFVSPENDFLQQQIKERLALESPKLLPVLNSAGTPRKVNKKYNFTLVKD